MNVRILSSVHTESVRIAHYFEKQQPGLGSRFFDSLDEAFTQIRANPVGYPRWESIVTDRDIRRVVMSRFPYLVLYEILPAEAVVFAVRHASQQPSLDTLDGDTDPPV